MRGFWWEALGYKCFDEVTTRPLTECQAALGITETAEYEAVKLAAVHDALAA